VITYADLAVDRTPNIENLAVLRWRLRAKVKNSALCDTPCFGRNLGAALRHA
jgi:protein O-GlcNAc transferase